MEDIKIIVKDKVASTEGTPSIICGNNDYTMSFTFDKEWNNEPNKVARFRFKKNGIETFIDVPIKDDKCQVPVLLGIGLVRVGVYAGELRTTTGAKIKCTKSILCDDVQEMDEPFENLYDELMEELKKKHDTDDVITEFDLNKEYGEHQVYSANAVNEEFKANTEIIIKSLANKETISNKVTEIEHDSPDGTYPTVNAVYNFGVRVIDQHREEVNGQIEALRNEIVGGLDMLSALIGGEEDTPTQSVRSEIELHNAGDLVYTYVSSGVTSDITKTKDGLAIVGYSTYFSSGANWERFCVVSPTSNGCLFSNLTSPLGTIEYDGKTYYYCVESRKKSYMSDYGVAYKTGLDTTDGAVLSKAILDYYFMKDVV